MPQEYRLKIKGMTRQLLSILETKSSMYCNFGNKVRGCYYITISYQIKKGAFDSHARHALHARHANGGLAEWVRFVRFVHHTYVRFPLPAGVRWWAYLVRVGPLTQYWVRPHQADPGTDSLLRGII